MERIQALESDTPGFLHYLHYALEQVTSARFSGLSPVMEPVLRTKLGGSNGKMCFECDHDDSFWSR